MIIEVTVDRIGGPDHEGPRKWGPRSQEVVQDGITWIDLEPSQGGPFYLRLTLSDVVPADDEFTACTVQLCTPYGQPLGTRPALIYSKPYDIPTHCLIRYQPLTLGAFSVGLRVIR